MDNIKIVEVSRDYRFDNLKGILIFLVVFGHVLSRFKSDQTPLAGYLYVLIYSFHMPAFIFISGCFSKPQGKHCFEERVIKTVLLPFVIFNGFMWVLTSHKLETLLTPAWTMWYLLSLFFWKISISVIVRIKHIAFVLIVLSLIIGFTEAGEFMAISKTIAFFPFFAAGYMFDKEKIEKNSIAGTCRNIISLSCMALAFIVVILLYRHGFSMDKVFTMKESYESMGLTDKAGLGLRAFALFAGFVLIACLISVVSEKQTFISKLGRNTITVFLGHSFIIRFFIKAFPDLKNYVAKNNYTLLGFAVLFSVFLCAVFGNTYVRKLYDSVMDIISNLVLNRRHVKNERQQE